jgi:hypothetical protein
MLCMTEAARLAMRARAYRSLAPTAAIKTATTRRNHHSLIPSRCEQWLYSASEMSSQVLPNLQAHTRAAMRQSVPRSSVQRVRHAAAVTPRKVSLHRPQPLAPLERAAKNDEVRVSTSSGCSRCPVKRQGILFTSYGSLTSHLLAGFHRSKWD